MLSGKKTYMMAAGGVLTAVGAYLSGELELGMMLNLVITSLLAVFLRKGITSDTGAAAATAVAAEPAPAPAPKG